MKAVRLVLALAALAVLQSELALAHRSTPPAEGGGVVKRSRDCHRNVIRHRIYGRMLAHRHVGSNCRVEIVRERDGRRKPRCIMADGKRICRDGD